MVGRTQHRGDGDVVAGASARVLLADDRAVVRLAVGRVLRAAGFTVDAISTRRLAIEPMRRRQHGVLLVGLHRPRLEGLVSVRRALEEVPGLAVVIMAAPDALDTALALRDRGSVDVLVKPCSAQALLSAVRRAGAAQALRRVAVAPVTVPSSGLGVEWVEGPLSPRPSDFPGAPTARA